MVLIQPLKEVTLAHQTVLFQMTCSKLQLLQTLTKTVPRKMWFLIQLCSKWPPVLHMGMTISQINSQSFWWNEFSNFSTDNQQLIASVLNALQFHFELFCFHTKSVKFINNITKTKDGRW